MCCGGMHLCLSRHVIGACICPVIIVIFVVVVVVCDTLKSGLID